MRIWILFRLDMITLHWDNWSLMSVPVDGRTGRDDVVLIFARKIAVILL